jgi:hypothetical protein
MNEKDKSICPHCGRKMCKWRPAEDSTWGMHFQYVCFNNECPYYVRGWKHMRENFAQHASYRHRYNPQNDESGPLPVWSENALRSGIVDDEQEIDIKDKEG